MDKTEVLRLIDDAHRRDMTPFVIVIPVANEILASSKVLMNKDEITAIVQKEATNKLMECIYAK